MQWVVAFALAVAAFWETVPPEKWTEEQLRAMFVDSPWAQGAIAGAQHAGERDVQIYLATAQPMRDAERELRRRTRPAEDVLYDEYQAWLSENAAAHIVLAVRVPRAELLADASEAGTMERESFLVVGRKKYPVKVLFAPSKTDPFVRLAFPRAVKDSDKKFEVEIFVPGVSGNYRNALFTTGELRVNGKLEL